MKSQREKLKQAKRIVIKIGSALITRNATAVNIELIDYLAKVCHLLMNDNIEVAIVSSGAIAEGMSTMGLKKRPRDLSSLQALAAIGQTSLIQEYETHFEVYQRHSAQILLTYGDLHDKLRHDYASSTIKKLIKMKIIPIINENDVVANDEIRFGDNDKLAAMTANLISADLLIILTDQLGLYTANPRVNKEATLISSIKANNPRTLEIASTEGGDLGSGGMYTKVLAAKLAATKGACTVIVDGKEEEVIHRVLSGETIGTLLYT